MLKNILVLGFIACGIVACNSEGIGASSSATKVTLDVRCASDTECPSGFECEDEVEHGVSTSYCVSDDEAGTSNGTCPAGYELETEHGGTFCKPHGGDDGNGGSDDSSSDDDAGSTGTAVAGEACQSSADCAAGLECEIEVENGVTTSTCKAHGGTP